LYSAVEIENNTLNYIVLQLYYVLYINYQLDVLIIIYS